jgi:hypothetical protein
MTHQSQSFFRFGDVSARLLAVLFFGLALITLGFANGSSAKSLESKPLNAKALPSFVELAPDEQLAHPVVKGSLGPWSEAYVVLTQPKGDDTAPFKGRVVIPTSSTTTTATFRWAPFPWGETAIPGRTFDTTVRAVMFRSIDSSPEKAVLVLFESYRIGSGKPSNAVLVKRWNGKEFVDVEAVQNQLHGARNTKEIDRRLAQLKTKGK